MWQTSRNVIISADEAPEASGIFIMFIFVETISVDKDWNVRRVQGFCLLHVLLVFADIELNLKQERKWNLVFFCFRFYQNRLLAFF